MARRLGPEPSGYFRRNVFIYAFLVVIFLMGAVAGSIAVNTLSGQQKSELMGYLQGFFQSLASDRNVTPQVVVKQSIYDNVGKTVGLMWLLGLSIIGIPLIVAIVFLRGFVLGFSIAFFVNEMVYRGLALAIVSIVPHNLIIVPAIILSAGAALSFSTAALVTLFGRRGYNMYSQFLRTTLLCIVAGICLVGAAFVEAYVTPALIQLLGRYIFTS